MKKKILSAFLIVVLSFSFLSFSSAVKAESNYKTGDTVQLGYYEQDGNSNQKEPIEWSVIAVDDSKALLLSLNGLEAISYGSPMDVNE